MKSSAPTIVPLQIKSVDQLAMMYMPFVRNGGLFIPTSKPPKLGDEIAFLLKLPGHPQPLKVMGRVIWINPPGGTLRPGFAIQFDEQDHGDTQKAITLILGSTLNEDRPKLYF